MTARISRLIRQAALNPLARRHGRLLPMSREDREFWAERQRRQDAKRAAEKGLTP